LAGSLIVSLSMCASQAAPVASQPTTHVSQAAIVGSHAAIVGGQAAIVGSGVAMQALRWRMVGPFRGGRTRAVAAIPGSPETILVGAVNGGVWKTDNDGRTWVPIFDAEPTQSIGAIAVAPSDPSVVYVATGEGLHRPDLSIGDGIYRSADGGRTWAHLGLEDAEQIPELAVDPKDSNRLFAAVLGHPYGPSAERGIYRSIDGGRSWDNVLRIDSNTGGSSVKLDPDDPNVVYAAMWNVRSGPWEDNNVFEGTAGGLYKSTDGGAHWQALKTGLPDNLSQIDIAVAPSRSRRLYAAVATTVPGDYSFATGLGVYRSDDAGESWVRITDDPRPALRIGGGDLPVLTVDPSNADVVYSASIVAMRSSDGGVHWSTLRGSPGGDDYQNLWVSPKDPRRIALVGDQGALVTVDGGATWSSWYNQPTAQLYHIGITPTFPYRICSGQQESGSVCISSRGNDGEITFRDWHPVGVIEYGYVAPDPLDPDIIYGAGRNVVTKTHLSTGQVQNVTPLPLKTPEARFDRTQPIFFSPQDAHRLYYAANRLYESADGGSSWRTISPDLARENPGVPPSVGDQHLAKAEGQRGVIYAVSPSPLKEGWIWAGTDDGLIWRTRNDGQDWQNVSPSGLVPWSKVTQLEASHFDSETAFASVSRFRVDDLKPYIYRTRDGGQSWQLITAGLPADAPVNTVREDPQRRGLLFTGTENAVWVSFDDGDHWTSLQQNLPHSSMRDLAVHGQDLVLATHGRSFWILDDISPLRQYAGSFATREAVLLKPSVAVRVRRSTGSDTPIPLDEPVGRNPPAGAVIDYYLGRPATGGVMLEVLDANGNVVRRAASSDPPALTEEELARELIPSAWIRKALPPDATIGMHRWIWDLHYPAPRTAQRGFPISAVPGDTPQEPSGPLAVPGEYRIRLYVGKHRWEQPLSVVPDPRVGIHAADYAAQRDLARGLADALDESTGVLLGGRSLRAQLKTLALARESGLRPRAQALDGALAGLLETPVTPGIDPGRPPLRRSVEDINADLTVLYREVVGADAAPTTAQATAAQMILTEWRPVEAAWEQLNTADVAALNLALRAAGQHSLRSDLGPPRNPDQADEE